MNVSNGTRTKAARQNISIGPRIKAARRKAGYSLVTAAKALGVEKSVLVRIERVGNDPRYSTLVRLVQIGLDPADFAPELARPATNRALTAAPGDNNRCTSP